MTAVVLGTSSERIAWTAVCHLADLVTERGSAALVAGEQVALVRLVDGSVRGVQNYDPFSGAHVMSRGIVGTRGDRPTLASPMYKQVFDLETGECLDRAGREPLVGVDGTARADLRTWPVRVEGGLVLVGTPLGSVAHGPLEAHDPLAPVPDPVPVETA